jgi:hypothetical protein
MLCNSSLACHLILYISAREFEMTALWYNDLRVLWIYLWTRNFLFRKQLRACKNSSFQHVYQVKDRNFVKQILNYHPRRQLRLHARLDETVGSCQFWGRYRSLKKTQLCVECDDEYRVALLSCMRHFYLTVGLYIFLAHVNIILSCHCAGHNSMIYLSWEWYNFFFNYTDYKRVFSM